MHELNDDDHPTESEAEATDELTRADADGRVHGQLGAPDQLGDDDVAELVAAEYSTDDDLTAEESAMHLED